MKASTSLLSKHHIDVIAGRTEKQAATLGELVALAEEVQRISITTDEGSVWLDSRNRGGARVCIVDAEPSRDTANAAAHTLGIQIVN